jgi:glycine cleavage system H protein
MIQESCMIPKNLRYATTHEWVGLEGDVRAIGITAFAVEQLTDVVFVELNKSGSKVKAGDKFGVIESVKAVSDLYAPVDGELAAINDAVVKDPSLVAADPYGKGWLIKIKVAPGTKLDTLLTAEQYEQQIASQGH